MACTLLREYSHAHVAWTHHVWPGTCCNSGIQGTSQRRLAEAAIPCGVSACFTPLINASNLRACAPAHVNATMLRSIPLRPSYGFAIHLLVLILVRGDEQHVIRNGQQLVRAVG